MVEQSDTTCTRPGSQLDRVARGALHDAYIVTNPRPVGEADVRAICQAAW